MAPLISKSTFGLAHFFLQELAPVIEFLRENLGQKPSHTDTKPHEENLDAFQSEVI